MSKEYIPIRLPKEEAKLLEEEARRENLKKSVLARKLIIESLRARRIERAIDEYVKGRCSLSYAANMAKLDLREFIAHLISRGYTIRYGIEELTEDLKAVEELGG